MIFTELQLPGAFLIEPTPLVDERGFFARTWCEQEFAAHGIHQQWVQCNISVNLRKGTLRGMHYQVAPHAEAKLIRCTSGALYDVLLDVRRDSPTHSQWVAVELSAANYRMLYIPAGIAHGFQTLADHTEVFYQMSAFYQADAARAVRWNDPAFAIHWPADTRTISLRDQQHPDYQP